jgi:hypothetical protein
MSEQRNALKYWWGNILECDYLDDREGDGRIVLKWTLKNQ